MNILLSEEEKAVLFEAELIFRRPDQGYHELCKGWFKPMHIGGTNGSRHSYILRKLARLGLIETERNRRPWGVCNSRRYRITAEGLKHFRMLRGS